MKNVLTVYVRKDGKISFNAWYPSELDIRVIKADKVEEVRATMFIMDVQSVDDWVNTIAELERM